METMEERAARAGDEILCIYMCVRIHGLHAVRWLGNGVVGGSGSGS